MEDQKPLEWNKCKKCGFLQYKTHYRCLKCKNKTFETIQASVAARLINYTILNAPPKEFYDKRSYSIGIIEFENGVRALGQLTATKNIKVGVQVKLMYQKICDSLDGKEVWTYVFKPVE